MWRFCAVITIFAGRRGMSLWARWQRLRVYRRERGRYGWGGGFGGGIMLRARRMGLRRGGNFVGADSRRTAREGACWGMWRSMERLWSIWRCRLRTYMGVRE